MNKITYKTPDELAAFQGNSCLNIIKDKFIKQIKNKYYLKLIELFWNMKKPQSSYKYPFLSAWDYAVSPGSGAHQAHYGGLALHILQDFEYAETLAKVYEKKAVLIDYDLLYTTIALHDSMKRFIYNFDENYVLKKAEDAFIAKEADHHSLVLHELSLNNCSRELILSVAAIHGIDDVSIASGVNNLAIVNHYLQIANIDLCYNEDDVRAEHVIAFLSDSDWFWSGRAQTKTGILADKIAEIYDLNANYVKLYLGSRFTFEKVGSFIDKNGYQIACKHYASMIS